MRIKFDGKLFSQEDMQELTEVLNTYDVSFKPIPKNFHDRKGLSEIENVSAWIAVLANALLPVLIQALYDHFKKRGKNGRTVSIDIERRSKSVRQVLSVSLDDNISEVNVLAKQDGEVRVFIRNASEDTSSQQ